MTLHMMELRDEIKQSFTMGDYPVEVYAIRPHLYRHLSPAGTLYIEIQDSDGKLVATSESITITAVGSGANYAHGHTRFYITASLQANTTYYVALKSSGYTYSDSAYVGWVNESWSTESALPRELPLDFEIWQQPNMIKGVV